MQEQSVSPGIMCKNCNQLHVGDSRFCTWCGQFMHGDNGVRLAGLGKRLLALILDGILVWLTLIIGYLIWWLIVLKKGQTPRKQIAGIWVIKDDGRNSGWGATFVREFLIKSILMYLFAIITLGIVGLLNLLWPLWDKDNQALHDKIAGTYVVQGPRT
jgi:uncharacterized RDD family membrane protein YckC